MSVNQWKYKEISKGHYLAVNICSVCSKEYNNGNVSTSLYCPECAKNIRRKKTAERVRRYREKSKKI